MNNPNVEILFIKNAVRQIREIVSAIAKIINCMNACFDRWLQTISRPVVTQRMLRSISDKVNALKIADPGLKHWQYLDVATGELTNLNSYREAIEEARSGRRIDTEKSIDRKSSNEVYVCRHFIFAMQQVHGCAALARLCEIGIDGGTRKLLNGVM